MDSWKFVNKVIGTPLNLFSKDFIPHCSNLNWLCLWWFDGIVLTCHSRIDCSTFISSLLLSYLIHSSKLSKQRRPSILSPSSHPLEAINGVLISLYFYKFSAPIFITLFQTCDIFLILLEVLSASVSISVSLCWLQNYSIPIVNLLILYYKVIACNILTWQISDFLDSLIRSSINSY